MKSYVEEVIRAVGHVMGLTDTSELRPETRLEADLGFDSGMFIELIMHLEDQIPGLAIDPAALRQEDFLTVHSTADFVAMQLRPPGASQ
jgi:acyl carrier protein